ncbi:RIIa domain-containing protein 1 isoform X3 [Crotalus tigris]|uniref:RIIa domain-containing protein 1 isoform X3 n=1 Tax=Crotalus tigris TaxID=88082 RepID=UPI00192F28F9|nr:RIIa domain-containing protein 1 isoform X3 [Crotalus tigris]
MVDVTSGLENLDVGALHPTQLSQLVAYKINSKINNEKYLRTHTEIEVLLSGFLRDVLMKRPENIQEFAADYFTNPELPKKIQQQMMEKLNQAT